MKMVRLKRALPIHFDDYDVFQSPLDDFKQNATAAGLQNRVTYLTRGETYNFQPPLFDTEAAAIASVESRRLQISLSADGGLTPRLRVECAAQAESKVT